MNFQTTIFRFSKNHGNPTRVTILKVAPNVEDPANMKQSVSSLKKEQEYCQLLILPDQNYSILCLQILMQRKKKMFFKCFSFLFH